ncbi:MAG: hypothetical protein QM612_07040 [Thermomonas sp.]|uniref:hypothetical protein n=1 Tax=Thermomonas sp. TaxID=1971895 RepID=UPI0039E45A08
MLVDRLRQAGLSTWLLAACCGWALLLWLGAALGMGGHIAQVQPQAAAALPQPKPPAAERIGPLAQYEQAASRPLFTRDRRPRSFMATAPENAEDGAPQQALDFILTGVLISPQVRLAIIQPSGGGESQRVRQGNAPKGAESWRLVDVQPRKAVFEGAGGQTTLELRNFGQAAQPPVAARNMAQQAADAAAGLQPVPPPPPPPPQMAGEADTQRIDDIRRRIDARRAQLRAQQQNQGEPDEQNQNWNRIRRQGQRREP